MLDWGEEGDILIVDKVAVVSSVDSYNFSEVSAIALLQPLSPV